MYKFKRYDIGKLFQKLLLCSLIKIAINQLYAFYRENKQRCIKNINKIFLIKGQLESKEINSKVKKYERANNEKQNKKENKREYYN